MDYKAVCVCCGDDVSALHDLQMSPQGEDEPEESSHRHGEENEVENKGSE